MPREDQSAGIIQSIEKEFSNDIIEHRQHPGRVTRVSARSRDINWSIIRQHYVLGKRKQLEDGSWISEDYTYRELCSKFSNQELGVKINYNTLKNVASQQNWTKLRKAYLARVNQINIGQELGLYTQENYQAEISAVTACNKLGTVLDRYIEYKFGDILECDEDTDSTDNYSEESIYQMESVNKAGSPIFLAEIKEAVNVAKEIYNLQRKIYDNAPKTEMEIIETLSTKPKFRSDKERQAKIAQLSAKLGKNLLELDEVKQAEITTIDI